jgi:hypothetical protein
MSTRYCPRFVRVKRNVINCELGGLEDYRTRGDEQPAQNPGHRPEVATFALKRRGALQGSARMEA